MLNPDLVGQYKNVDWNELLRADLGPAGQLNEVEPVFKRIKLLFDRLTKDPAIHSLSQSAIDIIQQELQNFLNFISNTIRPFSDVRQRSDIERFVKELEFRIINNLSSIESYLSLIEDSGLREKETKRLIDSSLVPLRNSIELQESKISQIENLDIADVKKFVESLPSTQENLSKALDLAEKLTPNFSVFQDAINKANEFISKNEEAVGLVVKLNATDAAKKAREHKTFRLEWLFGWRKSLPILGYRFGIPLPKGSYVWFFGSLFFGISIVLLVGLFIFETPGEVTIGNALLRISAILAPSYFALFCSQQFLNHRRLYEAYKFKDLALQTMVSLRQQFSDDSDSEVKKQITEEGIKVLFSEPAFKEDLKYDKNLFMEVMEILKSLRK